MIKILHSADWHLDAPMSSHSPEAAGFLRRELKKIPEKICRLCKAEGCDLMLLSGDLFDGAYTPDTLKSVQQALADVEIPVFIAPGNHDYVGPNSPYLASGWSSNVTIFQTPKIQDVALEALDCRIYGAGYTAMDCPALLQDFALTGTETYQIALLHGEVEASGSPYNPISRTQLEGSGLSYVALGHIHKGGSLRAGETLCAWPGCPMGHGYDELGAKGVIFVTLDEGISAAFHPLDTPRFYDEEVEAGENAQETVAALLPALPTDDFYRITLTGYSSGVDSLSFPHVPHLTVRNETRPEQDLWSAVGDDTLEGVFFGLLKQAWDSDNPPLQAKARLAARISRQILDGQEVKLP